jgi:hypothetical protein
MNLEGNFPAAFGGLLVVIAPNGWQNIARLDLSSSPVTLACKILVEMEREK